jgi:hypothetical protein
MSNCFTDKPDLKPYAAVPNKIPLDEMNKPLAAIQGKERYYAEKSLLPEFNGIDRGDDDLLNRILWFAARGELPYPEKFAGKASDTDDDDD